MSCGTISRWLDKRRKYVAYGLCLVIANLALATHTLADDRKIGEQRSILESLLKDPFDEAELDKFVATLPVFDTPEGGRFYIIEGDELLTRTEVEVRIQRWAEDQDDRRQRIENPDIGANPELIVNVAGGSYDYWVAKESRQLTYSVDRRSFRNALGVLDEIQYSEVVDGMAKAAADWENACPFQVCGITIRHKPEFDEAPSHAEVTFIVRYSPTLTPKIARAFYPHDVVAERYLTVYKRFFADYLSARRSGVLRHEIGHILGYRHEHLRGIGAPHCGAENDMPFFEPLDQQEDNRSVMYPLCGPGLHNDLTLSDRDIELHQQLYGRATEPQQHDNTRIPLEPAQVANSGDDMAASDGTAPASEPTELATALAETAPLTDTPAEEQMVVFFEGGDVPSNAVRIIQHLWKIGALLHETHTVVSGDTICSIYMAALDMPTRWNCPKLVSDLAISVNKWSNLPEFLLIGDVVKVPVGISFSEYGFRRTYDVGLEADLASLEAAAENWAPWQDKVFTETAANTKTIDYKGYSMRFQVSQSSTLGVLDFVYGVDPRYTYSEIVESSASAPSQYSMSPSEQLKRCDQNALQEGDEGEYSMLFGIPTSELPQCIHTRKEHSTKILLFDKPFRPNPDMNGAVFDELVTPLNSSRGKPTSDQWCENVSTSLDRDGHATHLAGIMVSQKNGSGFVGLSPGATLHTFDGAKYGGGASLAERLRHLFDPTRTKGRKVVVYASSFLSPDNVPRGALGRINNETGLFKDEDARLKAIPPARVISNNSSNLFVVAIGQPEQGKNPREVFKKTPLSPQNLGDLRNVIGVAACGDCIGASPKLLEGTHFSKLERLVHVAAPGREIVGHQDETHVAVGSGTSQAAAFVGGLAAAMYNCYPETYTKADVVKRRLQTTAIPGLGEEGDDLIQSGVVDPRFALLDPGKDWLKEEGEQLTEVEIEGWCRSDFNIYNPDGIELGPADGGIDVDKLLSISRVPGTEDRPLWYFFHESSWESSPEKIGDVRRVGPGYWFSREKLLKLSDGRTSDSRIVDLGNIERLVLRHSRGIVSCNN